MLTAILSIVILDLLLSADNAAIIGMAICRLPQNLRGKAAVCGTGAAIALRIVFTVFAARLIMLPYCQAIGGALLLLITRKLLRDNSGASAPRLKPASGFIEAICTIVLADLSMAFDNVLAVAGTAHGQTLLIVFGLLLSLPILVFCSTKLSYIMEKHPLILWLGAGVLLHTALIMIWEDRGLELKRFIVHGEAWALLLATLLLLIGLKSCLKKEKQG